MGRLSLACNNALVLILIIILIGIVISVLEQLVMTLMLKLFGGDISFFIKNRLTFVGVILHEASHALFAILSGAKVMKIVWFTTKNSRVLGSVSLMTRGPKLLQSLQLSLSAIAPTVVGLLSLYGLRVYYITHSLSIVKLIVYIYLVVSIFLHMDMSSEDIKVVLKGLPGCFLILTFIMFIFGIDVSSMIRAVLV